MEDIMAATMANMDLSRSRSTGAVKGNCKEDDDFYKNF